MSLQIKILPASRGDSILISYHHDKQATNILIDGGIGKEAYSKLKREISTLPQLDLLVITHIDEDHISGVIKLFQDPSVNKSIFKQVWFNSGKLLSEHFGYQNEFQEVSLTKADNLQKSVNQGITLESELLRMNCWDQQLIMAGNTYDLNSANLLILSPDENSLNKLYTKWEIESTKTKMMAAKETDHHKSVDELVSNSFQEDTTIPNGSSISFLFEFQGKRILLLGDSHPSIVVDSLRNAGYSDKNKLHVDMVKVSHHGSKHNTSDEFLRLIDSRNFVISSNGALHGLPDKECLSRIVKSVEGEVHLYFNYPKIGDVFSQEERERYDIRTHYLNESDYVYLLLEE